MTTWLVPFCVTSESTDHTAFRSSASCCFMYWKVNTTSAAVRGCPSVHFTPSRIVNVSVLLSFDHWYAEASHGLAAPLLSAFTKTSGSYTVPTERNWTAGLNGLNPQVHSPPCSLEIVRTPPTLPDDDDLPLLLVHATASRPTAATTAMTRMRFSMTAPHSARPFGRTSRMRTCVAAPSRGHLRPDLGHCVQGQLEDAAQRGVVREAGKHQLGRERHRRVERPSQPVLDARP